MSLALLRSVAADAPRTAAATPSPATPRLDSQPASASESEWLPFDPAQDPFTDEAALDLRFLNEPMAGSGGFIGVKDGHFVHTNTGQPVRFWAVNGPPHDLPLEQLRRSARQLAKHGVNMVRLHGGYFDREGEVDPAKVAEAVAIVEAMKAEGIYAHFSIYFPLWLTPKPGTRWLEGYDGKQHPFAALQFNPAFQAQYRKWWTALLTATNPASGKRLLDDPAVAGVEIQNEDSFFFWTFDEKNIPDPQLQLLEKRFGDWLVQRHGSIQAALDRWKMPPLRRDAPAAGRVAFRPLWNMFNERTERDRETAAFLFETQTAFYTETRDFLRALGFKGVITASNWATASPEVFGPLEKMSYAVGDFIDRHGYFECNHKGENAAWSIREGHTYSDRSALRFDAASPGKPRQFVHPIMDPHYDGKPSMISETTFCRPNRYRSEAPLYFAVYGALQDSDSIVHFALDSARWAVKPRFFMQQWTLMTPAMMGQFPAAALIYRRGLVARGPVLADLRLNKAELLQLRGTPLPQDAALDELRLQDVPPGTEPKPGQRIDPLTHYAGRTHVRFVDGPGSTQVEDLRPFIDHTRRQVRSATGELTLDYGAGLLRIDAPQAQGASGALRAGGRIELKDIAIDSPLELGHIVAVALDQRPLATSQRILLQVMSEEIETGRRTEEAAPGVKRIVSLGTDPWRVRTLRGEVRFKRADAHRLKVTPLDFNGYRSADPPGNAGRIQLKPAVIYYLIAP